MRVLSRRSCCVFVLAFLLYVFPCSCFDLCTHCFCLCVCIYIYYTYTHSSFLNAFCRSVVFPTLLVHVYFRNSVSLDLFMNELIISLLTYASLSPVFRCFCFVLVVYAFIVVFAVTCLLSFFHLVPLWFASSACLCLFSEIERERERDQTQEQDIQGQEEGLNDTSKSSNS